MKDSENLQINEAVQDLPSFKKGSEKKSSSLVTEISDTECRDKEMAAVDPTFDSNCGFTTPPTPIYEWVDITKDFFESIKELSLGELMHHEFFGLLEGMSAIEMMDPKMDAGMCCNRDTAKPLDFETAVSTGALKLENLEMSELIGVFDGIFSCMVSWLEGHSMAQTVFTCLYLHKPHSINDKSLKAFCIGIHKLIDLICRFIANSMIFEEEDFQSSLNGYSLFPSVDHNKCLEMLKEAEEELIKKSKAIDNSSEELHAVINRLKFLRFLLRSLIVLSYDGWSSMIEIKQEEINESVRLLSGASELLPSIKKTIEKGTQPDENSEAPNPIGFSPHVNQRLLPPTFPRYTKIKNRLSSISFLEDLVHRLKLACKVIYCTNYHSALNFFMEFSKKSGPCLLSRSILQFLYFPCPNSVFGTTDITDVLKESVKIFIAPPALMPRNPLFDNQQARECVDSFFYYNMNMQAFVTFLQICGFNRARQRDKLARLLDDFANLQDEAERVDGYLHSLSVSNDQPRHHLACFGTWVLYHCLRAMSLYLLSGLELELYSVHEYLYIFWYLYEFLFGWIVSALTRADSFLMEQECLTDLKPTSSKQQRKPKPNKKKKMKPYCREIMYNQAMQNMCGGYYKGLAGFIKEQRIPQPLSVFDNEKVRFDHRFQPFTNLTTPPPVPYAEFKKMRHHLLKAPAADLYLAAAKHFHQARTVLEAMPNPDSEMNDMLRIAKINFVVMNVLASGHKKDSTKSPEFDFTQHRYFPIIKQQ